MQHLQMVLKVCIITSERIYASQGRIINPLSALWREAIGLHSLIKFGVWVYRANALCQLPDRVIYIFTIELHCSKNMSDSLLLYWSNLMHRYATMHTLRKHAYSNI